MSKDTHFKSRLKSNTVIGKVEEIVGVIRFLTCTEAEEELRTKKPGSVILRIDKDAFRDGQKNVSLIVSYVFKTTIFHRNLSIKVIPRLKKRKDEIVCIVNHNQFKTVAISLIEFLKKLVVFLCAVVQNKNWIEKELQSLEIERLLTFRDFIIFPNRDRIIIMKKTLNKSRGLRQIKDLPIIIDIEKMGFLVFRSNSQQLDSSEHDFNKILLCFLEVEEKQDRSNGLLIYQSLGYDLDEFRKTMENDERIVYLTSGPIEGEDCNNHKIDDQDMALLLAILHLVIETTPLDQLSNNFPDEIIEPLSKISKAVKSLNDVQTNSSPEDSRTHQARSETAKMEWIKRGIFKILFMIFCLCGKSNFSKRFDVPLEICQNLLLNNQPGCRIFHLSFWQYLDNIIKGDFENIENFVGMFHALNKLITIEPLKMVFIKDFGFQRLLSIYTSLITYKNGQTRINISPSINKNRSNNIIFNAIPVIWSKNSDKKYVVRRSSSPTKNKANNANAKSPRSSVVRAVKRAKVSQRSVSTSPRGLANSLHSPRTPKKTIPSPRTPREDSPLRREEYSENHRKSLPVSGISIQKKYAMQKAVAEYARNNPTIVESHDSLLYSQDSDSVSPRPEETIREDIGISIPKNLVIEGNETPRLLSSSPLKTSEELSGSPVENSPSMERDDVSKSQSSTTRSPLLSPRTKSPTSFGFKLNLPTSISPGPLSPKVVVSPKSSEMSQRNCMGSQITPKLTVSINSFRSSNTIDIKAMAKKIGETYVSTDLTSLLSFKNEAERLKNKSQYSIQESTRLRKIDEENNNNNILNSNSQKKIFNNPIYKIKCDILSTLDVLSESCEFIRYNRSPVNLFYTELLIRYSKPNLEDDSHFLIYPILLNLATQIEIDHKLSWIRSNERVKGEDKKPNRSKMDLMLWRLRSRLISDCFNESINGLSLHLKILGDYMEKCSTRLMSTQAADVLMDILLKIKAFLIVNYPDSHHMGNVELTYALIRVFDIISHGNSFAPLNDMLLTIFVSKDETWNWIESYANMVLTNKEFQEKFLETFSAKYLDEIRIQIIKHYIVCVEMMNKQFRTPQASTGTKIEFIQKMEFLICPNTGLIQRLFSANPSFYMAKSMLKYLHKLLALRDKDSPLLSETYVDSYIGFHYLQFLRLYHNYSLDEETIVLCRKHLRILTDFAVQKNDKINQKFCQLKVIDFMTREISLEYEVEIMCKRYLDDLKKKEEEEKALQQQIAKDKTKSTSDTSSKKLTFSTVPKKGTPPKPPSKSSSSSSEEEKPVVKRFVKGLNINISGLDKEGKTVKPKEYSSSESSQSEKSGSEDSSLEEKKKSNNSESDSGESSSEHKKDNKSDSEEKSSVSSENSQGSESKSESSEGKPPPKKVIPPKLVLTPNLIKGASNIGNSTKSSTTTISKKPTISKTDSKRGKGIPSLSLKPSLIKGSSDASSKIQDGAGFLSQMEHAMKSENVKKMEDFLANQQNNKKQPKSIDIEESIYQNERLNRKLYYDTKLHIGFLEFILVLIISPNGFTLDPLFTNQYPMRILKINVLFILRLHLNHKANASILGGLAQKTQELNPSAFRMLKLSSNKFFQPSLLNDLVHFASGSYGRVSGCKLLGEEVAVKQMDVPTNIQERCVPHDIFTEITILDKWKADNRICKLIDYGVDDNSYWIVMKRYTTSLKDWREKQTKTLDENLLLYLNIYSDVLQNARFLEENMINHYDIKCDNFLIYPTTDSKLTKEDLYNQTSTVPNFSVCLADFGESLVYTNPTEGYTKDNRGTEFIKSPEMLTIAYAGKVDRDGYDRRKHDGAGPPSDIWSLGCLFYELLTGEFLFFDGDWVRFYILLTTSITADDLIHNRVMALNNYPDLTSFLKYVLIKDTNLRPNILDVINRFNIIKNKINQLFKKEEELRKKKVEPIQLNTEDNSQKIENEIKPVTEIVNNTDNGKKEETEAIKPERPLSPVNTLVKSTSFFKRKSGNYNRKLYPGRPLSETITPKLLNYDDDDKSTHSPKASSTSNSPITSQEGIITVMSNKLRTKSRSRRTRNALAKKKENKNNQPEMISLKKSLEIERQRLLQEQQEEIAAIKYQPTIFDATETEYFETRPTKITNYLFLGPHVATKNERLLRNKYGITHIVNCTKKENNHPEHFEYMNPPIPAVGDKTSIIEILPEYFVFVRKAGKKQGRIFVVSDDNSGSAAALVIGFLMDSRKLGFFEAYQIVLSKRYVIHLEAFYIQQLIGWEKKSSWGTFKEEYQCLCASNSWALLMPFDKTEHQNPIICGCSIGEYSECPYHGCGTFCSEMMKLEGKHSWSMRYLHWGHTTKDNIQSAFSTCEEYSPLLALEPQERSKIEEKQWVVYRCRRCLFLCYAENTKDRSRIAIITNLKKTQTKM